MSADVVKTVPEQDIRSADESADVVLVFGGVFTWGSQPFLSISAPDLTTLIRGGPVVISRKPSKWWHARAWYRTMRDLWRLP